MIQHLLLQRKLRSGEAGHDEDPEIAIEATGETKRARLDVRPSADRLLPVALNRQHLQMPPPQRHMLGHTSQNTMSSTNTSSSLVTGS